MGYENHPLREAIINHSGTTNVIVPGVAGSSILVYSLTLVLSGDALLTFKSGSTALTGPMDMKEAGAIVLDYNRRPWYTCGDGQGFVIALSSGVQISGRVYYTQSATDTLP